MTKTVNSYKAAIGYLINLHVESKTNNILWYQTETAIQISIQNIKPRTCDFDTNDISHDFKGWKKSRISPDIYYNLMQLI